MVIGVEGNVHVGKTTFINEYYSHFNIIKESLFESDLSNYERQISYINQEKNKLKNVKLSDDIIMDRTIISVLLYTFYSKQFTKNEQDSLCKIIEENIKNRKIIIPDKIIYICYPYKLIIENQKKLYKDKKTQYTLVEYDYYLKYSLFFSCNIDNFIKIYSTKDNRQVIEYKADMLFKRLTKKIEITDKIIVDGLSLKEKNSFIKNIKLKDNYDELIEIIVKKINDLKADNLIYNISFLVDIFSFISNKKISKDLKLSFLDKISSKVPLNLYITKIVYLKSEFDNNEFNFYKALSLELNGLINIHFFDKGDGCNIFNKIEKIESKPILLIDLLYAINCLIMKGIV